MEEGESRAHTWHWMRNLAALGAVDTGAHADHPLASVLVEAEQRTYVASNVSGSPLTVRFSDGTSLAVAPGQTATPGRWSWAGGAGSGGAGDHDGGTTRFSVPVDAGTEVGLATQVRVSYDLTGGGSWERVETYRCFASDPVPGDETYWQAAGLASSPGSLGDLRSGTGRVRCGACSGPVPRASAPARPPRCASRSGEPH